MTSAGRGCPSPPPPAETWLHCSARRCWQRNAMPLRSRHTTPRSRKSVTACRKDATFAGGRRASRKTTSHPPRARRPRGAGAMSTGAAFKLAQALGGRPAGARTYRCNCPVPRHGGHGWGDHEGELTIREEGGGLNVTCLAGCSSTMSDDTSKRSRRGGGLRSRVGRRHERRRDRKTTRREIRRRRQLADPLPGPQATARPRRQEPVVDHRRRRRRALLVDCKSGCNAVEVLRHLEPVRRAPHAGPSRRASDRRATGTEPGRQRRRRIRRAIE